MKLAPLLAQYLYQEKKLNLAGIGTFLLDPSARRSVEAQYASEGITFQYNASVKEDEDLVAHISTHTGKMKSLASSDLSSYLELALQFLNIGKPFQIEGIGTLVKNKSGELEFIPDHMLVDKVKDSGIKELSATSTSDESLTTYESLKPHPDKPSPYKGVFMVLLVIATTAVIIWAGYRMYKNNSAEKPPEQPTTDENLPFTDTTKQVEPAKDTATIVPPNAQSSTPGSYKFVIEVANRPRALYRYAALKKGGVPVQLATSDSLTYKLFFVLPATPADTARISDSLTIWYPARNHKRTFAEQ